MGGLCPLDNAGVAATDDDFTSDLTISTSDSCPSFSMASTLCGFLDTHGTDGLDKDVFVQGDTVQLDIELGQLASENSSQEMASFKAYIQTVGDNECDGSDCMNSYYLDSTACSFATKYASEDTTCTV